MVRLILNQTEIDRLQVNYGNPLLYPVIVSNLPSPGRGIFCISIVDLISKITLVLFSLLRESNYNYNKGPVIFDNIMILTIHGGFFYCLSTIKIATVSAQFFFYLRYSLENGTLCPFSKE